MKNKHFLIIFSAIVLAVSCLPCSKNKSQIVIKGSSTILPLAMKISEEYVKVNPVSISVTGTGSANGIKALIDGSCDIANSSRAIHPEELETAITQGIDVLETVIAYDMVVPIVHPSNPVTNVHIGQLREIYRGALTNWEEVGGKKAKIIVASRDSSSGTFCIWYKIIVKHEDITPAALLQATNGTMVYTIAENPNAIGYISICYLDKTVKALNVNNVKPTLTNGKNGKYPISRRLYMYINKKSMKKETMQFIDFVLSDQGQQLIKEAGYISL